MKSRRRRIWPRAGKHQTCDQPIHRSRHAGSHEAPSADRPAGLRSRSFGSERRASTALSRSARRRPPPEKKGTFGIARCEVRHTSVGPRGIGESSDAWQQVDEASPTSSSASRRRGSRVTASMPLAATLGPTTLGISRRPTLTRPPISTVAKAASTLSGTPWSASRMDSRLDSAPSSMAHTIRGPGSR